MICLVNKKTNSLIIDLQKTRLDLFNLTLDEPINKENRKALKFKIKFINL